jgi:chromosome segregation ATPase
MNSKNESFRKSLQYFDPTGEDAIRLKSIEGQLKAAMDKHRHKKKQFVQLKTDVQSLSNTLTTITKEQFTSTNSLESTKELFDATSKDISDIKTKMDRATNQASKLVKELRSLKRTDNKTDIENDIELRELRDLNSNILQELGTIANQNTNYATTIQLLLSQVKQIVTNSQKAITIMTINAIKSKSFTKFRYLIILTEITIPIF